MVTYRNPRFSLAHNFSGSSQKITFLPFFWPNCTIGKNSTTTTQTMDSVSITRLKASVFASVLAFYNALQAKQVKGPVFTHSIIEAIVSECHIIMSSFGRIDSIIIRNKETLASTLDPNTSHLGAISELALSGLSITLLLLREEVQQVTGEKVKFWKKVDYLWNEVTLNGLLANLHEQQIVWSLLVNSMQSLVLSIRSRV